MWPQNKFQSFKLNRFFFMETSLHCPLSWGHLTSRRQTSGMGGQQRWRCLLWKSLEDRVWSPTLEWKWHRVLPSSIRFLEGWFLSSQRKNEAAGSCHSDPHLHGFHRKSAWWFGLLPVDSSSSSPRLLFLNQLIECCWGLFSCPTFSSALGHGRVAYMASAVFKECTV